ncbi:MAG: hypothetical protein K9M75_01135 [Phycisphaerae bacterium]|nr:hypothetical protein [Phycisphaerae bacterium]
MMKKFLLTVLAIVALSAVSASGANVVGQFGILDVTANGGINPATGQAWQVGDTYRLIFVTSSGTQATSTDIATYNAFVQGLADAAGLGDASWNVVGSTAAVDARDNTLTNPELDGTGEAVFRMDGATVIANNYADLWDGVDPIDGGDGYKYSVMYDENGDVSRLGDGRLFTGTNADGTVSTPGQPLGGSSAVPSKAQSGSAWKPAAYAFATSHWMLVFSDLITSTRPVYGMSEPLTVKSVYAAKISYPMNNDDKVAVANPLTLEWINPDPNETDSFYATVWFGTDPCSLTQVTTDPVDGLDVTTADVNASVAGTYYWKVDITVNGVSTYEGDIWSFTTTANIPPTVVIDTPAMITWSGEPVVFSATVTDEGTPSILWTADPMTIEDPNFSVFLDDETTDTVTVTVNTSPKNAKQTVTLTITADDGVNAPVTDTVTVDVWGTQCWMTRSGLGVYGIGAGSIHDRNYDCITDLQDLAAMAVEWLVDYSQPAQPKP